MYVCIYIYIYIYIYISIVVFFCHFPVIITEYYLSSKSCFWVQSIPLKLQRIILKGACAVSEPGIFLPAAY